MRPRRTPLFVVASLCILALVAVACTGGEALVVSVSGGESEREGDDDNPNLSAGGGGNVRVGSAPIEGAQGTGAEGDPKCATNSDPNSGFTESTMKWGTIIPLTGALRPLGEQTARVMKTASEVWLNSITKIPGPYDLDWGCSQRPGIYGRKVSLHTFSLQANTPEEALAGMRRLIDVEKVFLVRDCYLESNLMGAANQYQNQRLVPAVWCAYSEYPLPQLAPWNFSPGSDPLKVTGIHVGWLMHQMKKQRLAIIADPTIINREVRVAQQIAEHFGHPIPDDCIVQKKAQEAPNGMDSEIAQIRGCYGPGTQPDAVVAFDVFNAAFGAMEARDQGWRGATVGVQWSCLTCWVQAIAELCADACEGMITDCQALPCIPWADRNQFPAAGVLHDTWRQYLSRDPPDILTYGPAAITGGLGLWLGMTGPNLSRDGLRNTLENLRDWDAGIGPILNTSPADHYGGESVWLMQFTGRRNTPVPWFQDLTGRFIPLGEVGVPESLTQM
ncbi:MAG: ABC transporter substrate-binding protein [Actinomycetota bacterium]